jgi:hypothetical protein
MKMKKLLMTGVALMALVAASATHAKTLQEWYGVEETPPAPSSATHAKTLQEWYNPAPVVHDACEIPNWMTGAAEQARWCKFVAVEKQSQAESQARYNAAGPEVHARACQDMINHALNPIVYSPALGYSVKSQSEKDLLLKYALEECERYNAIDRTLGKIK